MHNTNSCEKSSKQYRVFLNDCAIHTYDTQVLFDGIDETRMIHNPYISSYSILPLTEKSTVHVETSYNNIESVKIQPESKNIQHKVDGSAIIFDITPGDKLCITINGDVNHMLMLFANCTEVYIPRENDIYFPAGVHKIADNPENRIYMKSGQRLYIDSGAIVHGRIFADGCDDIELAGGGVLCGTYTGGRWAEWLRGMTGIDDGVKRQRLVYIENCKNLKISGLSLIDSDEWTLSITACENVDIDNIKIIGYQSNSDGIDICSTKNVTIKNTFVRTSDDCIVLKSMPERGETYNVRVENCTLWADRANGLEIGHEVCEDIHDAHFFNIDILNQVEETYGYHAIDICNADGADVYNITYENIRIEDCIRILGLRIREGRFSDLASFSNGRVHHIFFKDIYVKNNRPIFISGRNEDKKITDITFENFVIAGNLITDLHDIIRNNFFENIIVKDGDKTLYCLENYPIENLKPLDMSPMFNHILGNDRGIYGLQCNDWITLPSGEGIFEGMLFNITPQGKTPDGSYKRVVIPPNRNRLPFKAEMSLSEKATHLFFLHTGVNVLTDSEKCICNYIVTYDDNTTENISVRNQNDINEWNTWSLGGWQPTYNGLRMYIKAWENPSPDKKIIRLEMIDGELHEMAVLLAVTAAIKNI